MRRLKVVHYLQDPAHCAVAATASVANYYDSKIDYEHVKQLAYKKISKKLKKREGIDSSQICMLLNYLGFKKVTLISSDMSILDYNWCNYGRRKMKEVLKYSMDNKKDKDEKCLAKNLYKWYTCKGYNNSIKIDYNFGKYIRQHLNKKKPVMISFNWTIYMKFAKEGVNGEDVINGEAQEHEVISNGYDDHGIWIVDSHHSAYKYKRKKYRRGFYKMKWEHLMTCMAQGDVILPDEYSID